MKGQKDLKLKTNKIKNEKSAVNILGNPDEVTAISMGGNRSLLDPLLSFGYHQFNSTQKSRRLITLALFLLQFQTVTLAW